MIRTLILTLMLSLACKAYAQKTSSVIQLEQAISQSFEAFVEPDLDTLSALLTDDYVHINGSSGTVITKQHWLKWLSSRKKQIEARDYSIEEYEISQLTITLYHGKTATVTEQVTSTGNPKEKAFSSKIGFSNTWFFEDEQWLRAAFHDTPIEQ